MTQDPEPRQDPTAARLEYLARVLATPPASAHPCAADCGQPLTQWHVDAEGRHWHPDCLPPGTPMASPLQEQVRQLKADLAVAERQIEEGNTETLKAWARVRSAENTLDLATEFRIPCPRAADPGRPDGAPILQPEPLLVQKVQPHWADRFRTAGGSSTQTSNPATTSGPETAGRTAGGSTWA